MEDHSPRQIIKGFRAIEEKTGRSRPQLWRDIRSGTFPAPIKIGPNSVGFFADEVAAWLDARPRVNYAPRTARRTDTAA